MIEGKRDRHCYNLHPHTQGIPPPERLMTRGAVGPYLLFPQLLEDLDLLRSLEAEASQDPNVLTGTPCCPGVVEGVVRVVTSIDQTSVSWDRECKLC